MFKPPVSQVRVRPPTGVHFTAVPNPSTSAFSAQTAEFGADALYYTYAEVLDNGVLSDWASTSQGQTSLLVTNAMYAGSLGHTISMRVKHTVVSGGGYATDSDWVIAPETYVVGP